MARPHYPRGDRTAAELSAMLADRAEDVCRAYLRGGSRNGGYWRVGSVDGEPGQSLWVNLKGDDRGRWRDEAVPDHKGDLLDLIRAAKGIGLTAAMDEAARFLGLPPPGSGGGPGGQGVRRHAPRCPAGHARRSGRALPGLAGTRGRRRGGLLVPSDAVGAGRR